jgi:hypothetical protein
VLLLTLFLFLLLFSFLFFSISFSLFFGCLKPFRSTYITLFLVSKLEREKKAGGGMSDFMFSTCYTLSFYTKFILYNIKGMIFFFLLVRSYQLKDQKLYPLIRSERFDIIYLHVCFLHIKIYIISHL